jgi:type I site-specific restriction endonuclease
VSANSLCCIETAALPSVSQQAAFPDVGEGAHDSIETSDDLSNAIHDADLENEECIRLHGAAMEQLYRAYRDTSDPSLRERAVYERIEMERAIARRSPQQIARMQARQNERMRREPGATRQAA